MSQAYSAAESSGPTGISFGPRDTGGNSWLIVAILAAAAVLALYVWKKGK